MTEHRMQGGSVTGRVRAVALIGCLVSVSCGADAPGRGLGADAYPGATELARGGDVAFLGDRSCETIHMTYGTDDPPTEVVAFFEAGGFRGEWREDLDARSWEGQRGRDDPERYQRVAVVPGDSAAAQSLLTGVEWETVFTHHRCLQPGEEFTSRASPDP